MIQYLEMISYELTRQGKQTRRLPENYRKKDALHWLGTCHDNDLKGRPCATEFSLFYRTKRCHQLALDGSSFFALDGRNLSCQGLRAKAKRLALCWLCGINVALLVVCEKLEKQRSEPFEKEQTPQSRFPRDCGGKAVTRHECGERGVRTRQRTVKMDDFDLVGNVTYQPYDTFEALHPRHRWQWFSLGIRVQRSL